jgi:osmotically-inducible protein OsmY
MMDRALKQAVLSALYLEPLINAARRIVVTVRDGWVTLAGEVDTYAQKSVAKCRAQCVPGVKEVDDELEVCAPVKSGQPTEEVAASVLNALYWDLAVPPDRVSAKCEKGWVTLTGEVDRAYQKSSAEADVRKIRGVVGVTNEIKVDSSGATKMDTTAPGDSILLTGSMGAIADDSKMTAGRQASRP